MLEYNKLKGKIIVVEGCELMGKSTLIRNLAKRITLETELEVLVLSAPGTTKFGKAVRQSLIDDTLVESYRPAMMVAALGEMHYTEVEPAIAAGKVILMDRHLASTYAYQVEYEELTNRNDLLTVASAVIPKMPDLQIYLKFNEDLFKDRQGKLADSGREMMDNDRMSGEDAGIVAEGFEDILRYWHINGYGELKPTNPTQPVNVVSINPAVTEEALCTNAFRSILVTLATVKE